MTARTAHITLRDVRVGDLIAVQELRIEARDLAVLDGRSLRAEDAAATMVITEAALNACLAAQSTSTVDEVEVSTLTGRLRVSGRWRRLGGLPVPFRALGVPHIEGGARLQFDWQQVSVAGIPLPGVQMIGDAINAELARQFDITRLPIPVRLTGVTVEPGRIVVTGVAVLAQPVLEASDPDDTVVLE